MYQVNETIYNEFDDIPDELKDEAIEVFECVSCGEYHNIDDLHENNGDFYCEYCFNDQFTMCEQCNDYHLTEDMYYTAYGTYICEDCLYNEYTSCASCGDIYHCDDTYYSERHDESYCDNCRPEDNGYILDYHEFDDWEARRTSDDKDGERMFGIELEVAIDEDTAEGVHNIMNDKQEYERVIVEYDGSVDGYEIVSQPMTYSYIKANEDKWSELLKYLRQNGGKSHDAGTCGLHIHVSRPDEDIVNRVIMLMEIFKEELFKFSRRTREQVNSWSKFLTDIDENIEVLTYKVIDEKKNCNRYVALNTTNNRTIEFRLWRGTLNDDTFFATLELVKNIVEYCETHESLQYLTWNKLVSTSERLKRYSDSRNIKSKTRGKNILIVKRGE